MIDSPAAPEQNEFEKLTLPHLQAVLRFARSLTRDAVDAEDLVQETFLRALRGWSTFRRDDDARRWLFAICRNTFLRQLQRRRLVVESDDGDIDAMPAVQSHARAVQAGVGVLFDQLDVRPAIERAIAALPEPHHSILVLVDLEDHSYEEAGAILRIPPGTVRSRLFRARRLVQDALLAFAQDAGVARPRMPNERSGPTSPASSARGPSKCCGMRAAARPDF